MVVQSAHQHIGRGIILLAGPPGNMKKEPGELSKRLYPTGGQLATREERINKRNSLVQRRLEELRTLVVPDESGKRIPRTKILDHAIAYLTRVKETQGATVKPAPAETPSVSGDPNGTLVPKRTVLPLFPLELVDELVLTLDPTLTICFALPACAKYLGVPANRLHGRKLQTLINPSEYGEIMPLLIQARESPTRFSCHLQVVVNDTLVTPRSFNILAKPLGPTMPGHVVVCAREIESINPLTLSPSPSYGPTHRGHNIRFFGIFNIEGQAIFNIQCDGDKLLGYPLGHIMPTTIYPFIHPAHTQYAGSVHRAAVTQGQCGSVNMLVKTASKIWTSFYAESIPCVSRKTGKTEFLLSYCAHTDEPVGDYDNFVPTVTQLNRRAVEFDDEEDLVEKCKMLHLDFRRQADIEDARYLQSEEEAALVGYGHYRSTFGYSPGTSRGSSHQSSPDFPAVEIRPLVKTESGGSIGNGEFIRPVAQPHSYDGEALQGGSMQETRQGEHGEALYQSNTSHGGPLYSYDPPPPHYSAPQISTAQRVSVQSSTSSMADLFDISGISSPHEISSTPNFNHHRSHHPLPVPADFTLRQIRSEENNSRHLNDLTFNQSHTDDTLRYDQSMPVASVNQPIYGNGGENALGPPSIQISEVSPMQVQQIIELLMNTNPPLM